MWGKLKARYAANHRGARMGALITALVGVLLFYLPLGNGFVHYSFDLPAMFGPKQTPPEVLIVKLDELSLTELDEPYQFFNRSNHAQLLRLLTAGPARLVVFDIYFPESDRRTNDTELAEAIAANGRVVLAASYSSLAGLAGGTVDLPLRPLREAAKAWGLSVVEYDTDPTVRKIYTGTEDYASLPWAAAQALDAPVTRTDGARSQARWLRYYGDDGSLDSLSYYRALEQPAEYFRDKIIFIGGKPKTSFLHEETDEFHTPYTHLGGPFMSGVEVNATSFLNLLRDEWLTRLSVGSELFLLVIGGLGLGLGLGLLRPLPGGLVAVAVFVLTAVVACLFVWYDRTWFSWLFIAGAQVPCAWLCGVVWHSQRLAEEKTALEEKIRGAPGFTVVSPTPPAYTPPGMAPAGSRPPIVPGTSADGRGGTRLMTTIADHTLIRRIGKGAYGEVYLAQSAIGLFHAAKVIYRADFNDDDPYEREFRGIQKYMPVSMNHPGLVHLLHVGRNNDVGYFYYIMELGDDAATGTQINPQAYVAKNLSGELHQRERLPVAECVRLFLSLTEALAYLHTENLIHRDIKPSNIIFVKGVPKFADIGLVTGIAEAGQDVTYIGTEGYIAPEGPGSAAADLYSLGIVLYEAVTGLSRHQFPELPDTLTQRPDKEALLALNRIILRACERDLKQRYRGARDMHADLEALRALPYGAGTAR